MNRILIVNPFGIGDVIFSLYIAEAIKQKHPSVELDFLCNERAKDLVAMDSSIKETQEFNRDSLRALRLKSTLSFLNEYRAMIGRWKQKKYDAMLDYSLGREFSFLGYLAGIPKRVGFDYKRRGFFLNQKIRFQGYEGKSVAQRQLELLDFLEIEKRAGDKPLPLNISPENQKRAALFFQHEIFENKNQFMAVAPGGGKSWGQNAIYKQWDLEKFAECANDWCAESDKRGIFLTGDEADKPLLESVRRLLRFPVKIVCGQPLGVVAAIFKKAQFFLGNDGGLVHLAHALGVPTVSVFGPVDATVYGPYGHHTPFKTMTTNVPCRPCYHQFHFPPCPYERRCLTELSAKKVSEAIKTLFN